MPNTPHGIMPRYDFECPKGHVTEQKAERHLVHIICPECGEAASRVAVYKNQYIRGETVAKGR